ncbi:protein translocase SecG subunit [Clostridium sp. CAG:470]|jgi:preprotein translocase subunit SecG|nr:MAG: preprotein translocase subunit SecG [Clostridium sp. 28_17]CDE14783.1 protein translocase SecG subunit [Clostridium sp. CAG:470]
MEIVRTILTVIYFIIALVVIILALIQTKDDSGLSQTITGSSTSNFYEKNKGRTKEGKQKRMMVISSIVFGVLTLVLGILYLA